MRAVICRAWGSVDDLALEEVASPSPAPDEVLIDVRATSVNYADSIMVAGQYQTRPPFPFSPGLETAGVVAACGAAVTRFRPGDRVMATLGWGGLEALCVSRPTAAGRIAGPAFALFGGVDAGTRWGRGMEEAGPRARRRLRGLARASRSEGR